jgi:predicted  nucleic acid-binding Zn-ribbon protein
MNDTPRTDEVAEGFWYSEMLNHAEQLERELAEAKKQIDGLNHALSNASVIYDVAVKQRDALAVALQSLRSCIHDTRGKDAYEAVKNADEALQSLAPKSQ